MNKIFNDPTREYNKLSKNNFHTHIEATAKRVDQYKRDSSGLGTEAFHCHCWLNEQPPPEDQAVDKEADDLDSDDSSYKEEAEEDNEEEEEEDIAIFDQEVELAINELKAKGKIEGSPFKKCPNVPHPPKEIVLDGNNSGGTRFT